MGADAPREPQRFPLFSGRLTLRHHLHALGQRVGGPGLARFSDEIALLRQHRTEDAAEFDAGRTQRVEVGDDHPHVHLLRQDRLGGVIDRGRDDRLDEGRDDRFGGGDVEGPVQRHDATERREAVGFTGADVGIGSRCADGGAARVRVLDHHGRRLVELERDARGSVEVEQVGVRQFLALQDGGRTEARGRRLGTGAVPGGLLVRILAVAEVAQLLKRQADRCAERRRRAALELLAAQRDLGQRLRDRGVVRRGVRQRLAHQLEAERQGRGLVERGQQLPVVGRVDDHQDAAEVLGGRTHHRGTADVDLLDQCIKAGCRVRRGLHEGVEVDHHDVDEAEAVPGQRGEIVRTIASGEDAAVQGRMQRLHPTVHHLGEAGDRRDVGHRQAGVGEGLRGAAGRHQFEAARDESATQFHDSGLVRYAQKGSWHRY